MGAADSKLTFTASPVYTFLPDVSKSNIRDQLTARIGQLSAMLLAITGEGFESFNNLNEDYAEKYLWACMMLAAECRQLNDHI